MIKELVKLSDRLDQQGFHKEANILDILIEDLATGKVIKRSPLIPTSLLDISQALNQAAATPGCKVVTSSETFQSLGGGNYKDSSGKTVSQKEVNEYTMKNTAGLTIVDPSGNNLYPKG